MHLPTTMHVEAPPPPPPTTTPLTPQASPPHKHHASPTNPPYLGLRLDLRLSAHLGRIGLCRLGPLGLTLGRTLGRLLVRLLLVRLLVWLLVARVAPPGAVVVLLVCLGSLLLEGRR